MSLIIGATGPRGPPGGLGCSGWFIKLCNVTIFALRNLHRLHLLIKKYRLTTQLTNGNK